ncbi:MAG: PAS domain-containing protein, partial [Elusimicrobiales bacterium]|nr:PAS domain-containing protein [Elusimicrobiales bacterium]
MAKKENQEKNVLNKEKILNSAKEWSETFDSMSDGVSIHSSNREILNINKSLAKIFNKEKKDIIGKKCYEIFHNLESPINECPLKRSLKTKKLEEVIYFEPTLNLWLTITANPVFNNQGRIIKVVHIVRNITERKQAEKKIKKHNIELER